MRSMFHQKKSYVAGVVGIFVSMPTFAQTTVPPAVPSTCSNFRETAQVLNRAVTSSASAAVRALSQVIDSTVRRSRQNPPQWRQAAFDLGALTGARVTFESYVRACNPDSGETLDRQYQAAFAADEIYSEPARVVFAQLFSRELSGFTLSIPHENGRQLTVLQLRDLKRAVEANVDRGNAVRSSLRNLGSIPLAEAQAWTY